MASNFFSVIIDDRPTRLEKNRVISIEPYEFGTKIILEASHAEEEPFVLITPENYENVMQGYLGN
jgi:hypothetical protein